MTGITHREAWVHAMHTMQGYENDVTCKVCNVGTVDHSTSITVSSQQSKCDTCKNDLTIEDKHKGSDKYWKNCRTCRERKTASKRKRKAPSTSSTIVATTDTTKKRRKTYRNPGAIRQALQQVIERIGRNKRAETSNDKAFRDDLLKRTRENRRAEISNNEASEESSRVVVLKLPKENVCSVCAETLPWQRFPRLADCEHDPDVCDGCFLLWLKQQMESVTNVLCPSSGCNHAITHEDVRLNTPQDVFTR
jgi:hypothetical protein